MAKKKERIDNKEISNKIEEIINQIDFQEAKITSGTNIKQTLRDELYELLNKHGVVITDEDKQIKAYKHHLQDDTQVVNQRRTGVIAFKEEEAIKWLKENKIPAVIQTKEYIPMDKWEAAKALGLIPQDKAEEFENRKETTFILTIKPSSSRKEKRENQVKKLDKLTEL